MRRWRKARLMPPEHTPGSLAAPSTPAHVGSAEWKWKGQTQSTQGPVEVSIRHWSNLRAGGHTWPHMFPFTILFLPPGMLLPFLPPCSPFPLSSFLLCQPFSEHFLPILLLRPFKATCAYVHQSLARRASAVLLDCRFLRVSCGHL